MSVRRSIVELPARAKRAPAAPSTKLRQGMPRLRGEASGMPGLRTANRQRDTMSRLESLPFGAGRMSMPYLKWTKACTASVAARPRSRGLRGDDRSLGDHGRHVGAFELENRSLLCRSPQMTSACAYPERPG